MNTIIFCQWFLSLIRNCQKSERWRKSPKSQNVPRTSFGAWRTPWTITRSIWRLSWKKSSARTKPPYAGMILRKWFALATSSYHSMKSTTSTNNSRRTRSSVWLFFRNNCRMLRVRIPLWLISRKRWIWRIRCWPVSKKLKTTCWKMTRTTYLTCTIRTRMETSTLTSLTICWSDVAPISRWTCRCASSSSEYCLGSVSITKCQKHTFLICSDLKIFPKELSYRNPHQHYSSTRIRSWRIYTLWRVKLRRLKI